MTRVLVVVSSTNRRGAEIQGTELGSALVGHGVEATVLALCEAEPGAPSIDVPALGSRPLSPRVLRGLRQEAARSDVVIGYGSKSLPACAVALLGLPTRFVYRSIGDPRAWSRGGLHRLRTATLYRRPDHVVTLWDGAAQAISDLYGVADDKLTSIPNARFADRFEYVNERQRRDARRAFGVPPGVPLVGWLGSMGPEKCVTTAIDAVVSQAQLHLAVVGNGQELDRARAAAAAAPDRIHLVGPMADPSPFYAAIDAIVSTSWTEGMPGVIIEAALAGRPAVATDVGASHLVVGRGGRIVPAQSTATEIGDALAEVIDAKDLLGPLARSHASENFTWDEVAPYWLRILNRVTPGLIDRSAG